MTFEEKVGLRDEKGRPKSYIKLKEVE